MARDVISAKLDIIFKKFFSENTDMLKDFIAGILEIPLESIQNMVITNTELPPEMMEGKFSRLDLSLKIDDKLVNVEVQINNDSDYCDRAMFYWSKLFTSELESGMDYSLLKPTITINILDFVLFPERSGYHSEIVTSFKDTKEILYDKFRIHFFELKKLSKKYQAKNRRELWLQFLNAESEEDYAMLENTNDPVMKKAVNIIYDMSEDTRIREIARLREKALHDEASAMNKAKREGRAEGVESVISAMRSSGMTDEQINSVLGFMS